MKNTSLLFWVVIVGEAFIILFTLFMLTINKSLINNEKYAIIGLLTVIVYIGVKIFLNSNALFETDSILRELRNTIIAWITTKCIIIISLFLFKISDHYSRFILGFWFIITPFIIFTFRWGARLVLSYIFTKEIYQIRVAVLGDGGMSSKLVDRINNSKYLGMKIVKTFSSDELSNCIESAQNSEYDRLYVVKKVGEFFESASMLDELSDTSVVIYYVPDMFGIELIHSSWSKICDIDVMIINDSPIHGINLTIKRIEDVILSLLILVLVSPVLLITSIAILVTSRGPLLFKQSRYGLNGREIKVWKFRSMSVCENNNIVQAKKDDPRVTTVGKFIRRTSIDELPQFFNVLKGTMSIVGPRPHAIQHNEEFRKIIPNYMRRHIVKPGITGWAQINGWRGETDTNEKIIKRTEYDIFYIKNWSLWLDLKIIILTFKEFVNNETY